MARWIKRGWRVVTLLAIGAVLPSVAPARDADEALWRQTQSQPRDQAAQAYLDRFPTGRHAAEAFDHLLAHAESLPHLHEDRPADGGVQLAQRQTSPRGERGFGARDNERGWHERGDTGGMY